MKLKKNQEETKEPSKPIKLRKKTGKYSYSKKMLQIRMALENSIEDGEIMTRIERYGYDETTLRIGLKMLEGVESLSISQHNTQVSKEEASRKKTELGKTAEKMLSRFLKTGRLAFENDPGKLILFKSPGRRRWNFAVWLEHAKLFYTNVFNIPGILEGFMRLDVSREELETGKNKLLELENQSSIQSGLNGDKQVARDQKKIALTELMKWWAEYRKISRIALKDSPQLLEKLGIIVPSQRI